MNRHILLTAGLAVASATAGLALATPAQATPGHGHGHGGHSTTAHAGHGSGHASGHRDKNARRLAHVQAKAERQIAIKDAALVRILGSDLLSELEPVDAATLTASIGADRTRLSDLGQALVATTTVADAEAVASEVAQLRPAAYAVALGSLAEAAQLQVTVTENATSIADLTAQADQLEAAGQDVTAVRSALDAATQADDQATVAATAAHDLAVLLTAESTHADIAAVGAQLEAATTVLETAAQQLQVATDAIAALQVAPAPVV